MGLDVKVGTFALNTSTGSQSVSDVGFQPKVVIFFGTSNTADGIIVDRNMMFGVATSSTSEWVVTDASEDGITLGSDTSQDMDSTACIMLIDPGSSSHLVIADFTSMDAGGFTFNISDATGATAYRIGYLAIGGSDLTNVATGVSTMPAGTGNDGVTGVGFQPDTMFFATKGSTRATLPGSNSCVSLGFASGSSNEGVIGWAEDNGQDPSVVGCYQENDACIGQVYYNDMSLEAEANLASFDSDGFTLNWTATIEGDEVFWLALEGAQFHVGDVQTKTGSTGTVAETGVGFTPSAGVFMSINQATSASVNTTDTKYSIGAATASAELVIGGTAEDAQSTTNTDQMQDDAHLYFSHDYAQTRTGSATLDSWDSDGFTLNYDDDDPAAYEMVYWVVGASEAAGLSVNVSESITVSESATVAKDVQFIRPDSDVSKTDWTGVGDTTNLYNNLNEVTASDSDYDTTSTDDAVLEVGLTDVADPDSSVNHIIRWRRQVDSGTGQSERETVQLYEGGTLRATAVSASDLPDTWASTSYTLSGAEADAISDYTDLRLRFTAERLGGGESYQVSWAEMEIPPPTYPTPSVSDSITVSESVTVSVQVADGTLTVNVSDNITVAESITLAVSAPQVDTSQAITVSESVTVSSPAATTLTISVSDSITVAETVSATVSAPQIDTTQAVTVAEAVTATVSAPQIDVTDNITVAESVAVSVNEAATLSASATDNITVAETVSAAVSAPQVDTTQAITVSESVTVSLVAIGTLTVSVADNITVAEAISATVSAPQVDVTDNITVSESVTVDVLAEGVLSVSVSESVTVAEAISATVSAPQIDTTQAITVAESIDADVSAPQIDTTQAITVSESVTVSVSAAGLLQINVSESITVSESVTVSVGALAALSISVSESITVAESVTISVGQPTLQLAATDAITVSETVTLDPITVVLSVLQAIIVSESVAIGGLQATLYDITLSESQPYGVTMAESQPYGVTMSDATIVDVTMTDVTRTN